MTATAAGRSTERKHVRPVEWPEPAPPSLAENIGQAQMNAFGMVAFIVVTVTAACVDLQMMPASVVPMLGLMGLVVGGFGQLIPGLFQAHRGDSWHAAVFSGYGLFWITKGAYLLWLAPNLSEDARRAADGAVAMPWILMTLVFLIAALRINMALVVTMVTVLGAFTCMTLTGFTGSTTLSHITGGFAFAAAACVLYLLVATLVSTTFERQVIPLGPLPRSKRATLH